MTAIATLIAVGIDSGVAIPNISLIFVVPVVVAGVGFGLGPSLCSAVLGALAYNFFLTEPRYTLLVDDPANIWAIGLLFVIGLIVSSVAYTSRRRATDAALLRSQAAVLQDYGRAVVAAASMEAIVSTTVQTLAALFQVPVAVMTVSGSEVVSVNAVGDIELQEAEFEAARSSLEMRTVIRAETYPATASRFEFWPVKTSTGQCAAIGLAFNRGDRLSEPETSVDIVRSVLALALDRQHTLDGRDARSAC
ncbi:DUF4118 domain-containing protein [Sinorhizobium terangae]|uniref:DUF4118 domain-containing protein n=1 Tax=Sinorhizobium terangae TaxID=110322 RepID=UPI0024B1AB9E|nr:DUF4118 domain-containing protein [Sinorhizobium terangae]WFU51127.1 DUF4118 domain-containing protein [Sinorhizobium terangae]